MLKQRKRIRCPGSFFFLFLFNPSWSRTFKPAPAKMSRLYNTDHHHGASYPTSGGCGRSSVTIAHAQFLPNFWMMRENFLAPCACAVLTQLLEDARELPGGSLGLLLRVGPSARDLPRGPDWGRRVGMAQLHSHHPVLSPVYITEAYIWMQHPTYEIPVLYSR